MLTTGITNKTEIEIVRTGALCAFAITAALCMAMPAHAADWIEKVSVGPDGIDIPPIEVNVSSQGYTSIKTPDHRFSLRLYARATNGERIVAAKIGMYNGVNYFEGDGNLWSASLANREVGGGELRTLD